MPEKPTGRPPIFDVAASTRVTVSFTPGQRDALLQMARELGVTVSAIARQAMNRYTADYDGPRVFVRSRA